MLGAYSIRGARRGGRSGWLGLLGIVISLANIVVGILVLVSFLHYESSLAEACASVAPGRYVTGSGYHVSCR